jgi:hypothetical protein
MLGMRSRELRRRKIDTKEDGVPTDTDQIQAGIPLSGRRHRGQVGCANKPRYLVACDSQPR